MIKKILNNLTKVIDNKEQIDTSLDKKIIKSEVLPKSRWTKEQQELIIKIMDNVPKEQRIYH